MGNWATDIWSRILAGPTWEGLAAVVGLVALYCVGLIVWAHSRPGTRPLRPIPTWATSRGRTRFVAISAVGVLGLWFGAFLLAPDSRTFLTSREWQVQPLYLFAHFVTLRLFASIFASNYVAGVAKLDRPDNDAIQSVRHILGLAGLVPAIAFALPFIAADLRYFLSGRYAKLSGTAEALPVDWLMFGIWAAEWLVNGYIWVLLVGFLVLNVLALQRHAFKSAIHVVLAEAHYRPFLRMSAQGATVVLMFSLVTAGYILWAGGELTDYLGLIFTAVLLAVSFVPPWLVLRRKVNRLVQADLRLLQSALDRRDARAFVDQPPAAPDSEAIARQHQEAIVMMRMIHLERLHGSVGQREAMEVAVRLVAPLATIGWQVWQHGAALVDRLTPWLRVLTS